MAGPEKTGRKNIKMKIYSKFETAKSGIKIPLFNDGRSMESRYNPLRDAENLLSNIKEDFNFFLVIGIGSGLFIDLLSQKFPAARIIAFELYEEDLLFLAESPYIQKLKNNPLVTFANLQSLEEQLIQNYLPAKYGDMKIIEQKSWINENLSQIEKINNVLNKTLGLISADYSVQAHFGKIWNSNILNNSRIAEECNSNQLYNTVIKNNKKTAVIIAAGPSLDKTLDKLRNEIPDNYYIIATDTAGQALAKRNLTPDLIVSIDAQSVSYNHFVNNFDKKTIYAFDLCANASAVRHLSGQQNNLFFFCSGHPLSTAINSCSASPLPVFFSGAGTVTITALDLALSAGFKNIMILGADFAYSNGKAYTAGTYLDTLYNMKSSKLMESETSFTRLMFRTELLKLNPEKQTTSVLQAYCTSMENYLNKNKINFYKKDEVYYLTSFQPVSRSSSDLKNFSLRPFINKIKETDIFEAETFLLPYVAWLRNNSKYKKYDYIELLKLALDSIVSYNI